MREDLLASDKHLDINSSRIAKTPTADNDTPATVEVKSQSSVPMWERSHNTKNIKLFGNPGVCANGRLR